MNFFKKVFIVHTIICVIYSIEKAMDNNLFVCEIFVDLQETFDTIDHCFKNFPIRDLANSWFFFLSLK